MAVFFDELTGISPRLSASAGEVTATRVGLIAWSDMDALYRELFPAPVNGIAQMPATFPGRPLLYAERVEFGPLWDGDVPTSDGPPLAYDLCRATIEYRTTPYEQQGSQLITRRVTVGGQYMTLPNYGFRFADTGQVVICDAIVSKFIGTIDHEITVHRTPTIPWPYIRALAGRVNSSLWIGAAAETVLFMGVDIQQVIYSDGSRPYQITYKFQERNIDGDPTIGWNHVFDPTHTKKDPQGKWRPILQANGEKPYKTGNFNYLL